MQDASGKHMASERSPHEMLKAMGYEEGDDPDTSAREASGEEGPDTRADPA